MPWGVQLTFAHAQVSGTQWEHLLQLLAGSATNNKTKLVEARATSTATGWKLLLWSCGDAGYQSRKNNVAKRVAGYLSAVVVNLTHHFGLAKPCNVVATHLPREARRLSESVDVNGIADRCTLVAI